MIDSIYFPRTYRKSAAREAIPLPNGKFKTPESVRRYTNSHRGRLGTLLKGAKVAARDKALEFRITTDDIQDAWDAQQGLCAYTGWPMSTETRDPRLVSLERKNCNIGYVKDNCILVCWSANRAKSILTHDEFVALCTAVYKHHQVVGE